MSDLTALLTTLESLRSQLPERCREEWAADHDCEWDSDDAFAYLHPASDQKGGAHYAIAVIDSSCDFRSIEAVDDDEKTRYFDRAGQAITAYVAALHNALPVLAEAVRIAEVLREHRDILRVSAMLIGDGTGIKLREEADRQRANEAADAIARVLPK